MGRGGQSGEGKKGQGQSPRPFFHIQLPIRLRTVPVGLLPAYADWGRETTAMTDTPFRRMLHATAPDFWRLWGVGLIVFTVRWLETVAVGVVVYQRTGSPIHDSSVYVGSHNARVLRIRNAAVLASLAASPP